MLMKSQVALIFTFDWFCFRQYKLTKLHRLTPRAFYCGFDVSNVYQEDLPTYPVRTEWTVQLCHLFRVSLKFLNLAILMHNRNFQCCFWETGGEWVRDRLQISLLIFSECKWINQLLFTLNRQKIIGFLTISWKIEFNLFKFGYSWHVM